MASTTETDICITLNYLLEYLNRRRVITRHVSSHVQIFIQEWISRRVYFSSHSLCDFKLCINKVCKCLKFLCRNVFPGGATEISQNDNMNIKTHQTEHKNSSNLEDICLEKYFPTKLIHYAQQSQNSYIFKSH